MGATSSVSRPTGPFNDYSSQVSSAPADDDWEVLRDTQAFGRPMGGPSPRRTPSVISLQSFASGELSTVLAKLQGAETEPAIAAQPVDAAKLMQVAPRLLRSCEKKFRADPSDANRALLRRVALNVQSKAEQANLKKLAKSARRDVALTDAK